MRSVKQRHRACMSRKMLEDEVGDLRRLAQKSATIIDDALGAAACVEQGLGVEYIILVNERLQALKAALLKAGYRPEVKEQA